MMKYFIAFISIFKKSKYLFVITLSISGLVIVMNTYAQDQRWRLFNKENTMFPGVSIHDIVLDKDGNKWIAHTYGLTKLNGMTWSSYNTENSGLPDDIIYSLAFDRQDNLWIGSSSGLTKYDGKEWTIYNRNEQLHKKINHIESIAVDYENNVWFGVGPSSSDASGLYRFDGTNWVLFDSKNSPLQDYLVVTSIKVDIDSSMWIGTQIGLVKYYRNTWEIYNQDNSGLPFNYVFSLSIDKNGNKWVGSYEHGVAKFDGHKWTVYDTPDSMLSYNTIYSIAFDSNENVWFGTYKGLVKYNFKDWRIYNTSNSKLPDNFVKSLLVDNKDTIWIGTADGGLAILSGDKWNILNQYTTNYLPENSVGDIEIDMNGNAWIAAYTGLTKFDRTFWNVYNPENSQIPSSMVYDIEIDKNNNKWIATEEGLAKYNGESWDIFDTTNSGIPLYNAVKNLSIDLEGNIWLSTTQPAYVSAILEGSGLTKFDGVNWTIYNTDNSGIPVNYVLGIKTDNEGNVWFGTGIHDYYSGGLVEFDGNKWNIYNMENSGIPGNIVSSIAFDGNRNKWIGTTSYWEPQFTSKTGGGLAKFDGINWTVFNKENSPLPSNDISALLVDSKNNLWVGTRPYYVKSNESYIGGGLVYFNGNSWQIFTTGNSPLPSNAITSLAEDSRGNIWIGTNPEWIGNGKYYLGGIAIYNPDGVVLDLGDFKHLQRIETCRLLQNYPNPFNPVTRINYSIIERGPVLLKVYDLLGREVAVLVNEEKPAGTYTINFDASSATGGLSSGVYFYYLQSGSFAAVRKLVFLK